MTCSSRIRYIVTGTVVQRNAITQAAIINDICRSSALRWPVDERFLSDVELSTKVWCASVERSA